MARASSWWSTWARTRRSCSAFEGRLLAASSPTGPAFEGAQISGGQRAAPGAIERVRIDPLTLEPRFRIIGCPLWSDEPGFAEATADLGVSGICGSGIVEVVAQLFLAGVVTADGVIDGALAARTPRVIADGRTFAYVLHDGSPRLVITQNDVRAIQLAKAALYAGVRLLMDHAGVEAVDGVRLAGAFGSQIDGIQAMVLGLVPDCDPAHVEGGRQRRRDGRPHGAPVAARAARDRGDRAPRREDRDGGRAELPGPLRGRPRVPPSDSPVHTSGRCRDPARSGRPAMARPVPAGATEGPARAVSAASSKEP